MDGVEIALVLNGVSVPVTLDSEAVAAIAAQVPVQDSVISPYMTVVEAAEYLRAKPQRIYDLLSAGRLTRHKDGRRVLIAREEIDALLNGSQRVAPGLPAPTQTRMDRSVVERRGNR